MCIPKGAEHLAGRHRPTWTPCTSPWSRRRSPQYVNYITPVPEAKAEIVRLAEHAADGDERERLLAVAESSFVFPDEASRRGCTRIESSRATTRSLAWDETFRPVFEV